MGKLKRMDQIRNIIEVYVDTGSIKGTAKRLQVSKNTVRQYVRRAKIYDQDLSKILLLSEDQFLELVFKSGKEEPAHRDFIFSQRIDYWIKELRRVGVTKHLLWEEYRLQYPEGFGYSQFCVRLKREIGRRDLTIPLNHVPGEKMQLDFAGKPMRWIDPHNGEVHTCEVLVGVMPHSHYTFAIALKSQRVEDFIYGINQALLFFGKLPKVILSDNLKSFVVKADRYDPDFNELCIQLAAHFQIDLQATRVGKPKDKGSVENMVGTAYSRIYAPLRDEIFHSITEINEGINRQLKVHNNKSFQKKQGCRLGNYEQYEYPVMKDLPSDIFEIKKSTQSKVQRNYHVYIGQDKNFYSVPYQYVGRQATVIYTTTLVEIYIDNQRIATHTRLLHRGTYVYQTNESHMPTSHREWKKARGYDEAYFIGQAEKIGHSTQWAIGYVLLSKIHQPQSYNSCLGILRLINKYSEDRLERACLRCQDVGKASYGMIKNILARNLDQLPDTPDLFSTPDHDNIRGPEEYQ